MRNPLPCLVILAAVLALACGGGAVTDDESSDWQATTTSEGDRTVVRTTSGSIWGGAARMVEEAVIGVEVGEDPYMLGRVAAVAASTDRIYVLDASLPVVRVYDMAGEHIHDIGAAGDGSLTAIEFTGSGPMVSSTCVMTRRHASPVSNRTVPWLTPGHSAAGSCSSACRSSSRTTAPSTARVVLMTGRTSISRTSESA